MKLLIEAGSSKTDFALIDSEKVIYRDSTTGMNPVTDPDFEDKLSQLFKSPALPSNIGAVYYYGTGCINREVNGKVSAMIGRSLGKSTTIEIHDDLLGACRSVSNGIKSLVCILGTGSNICYFDGQVIRDRVQSCGYLLGDEGSGFRMGQEIYLRLVRHLFPLDVENKILKNYKINHAELITLLYSQPNPRTFLAQFSNAHVFLDQDTAHEIAEKTFYPLIQHMILPLKKRYPVPVSFIGSISFHFSELLNQLLQNNDVIARCFEKTPLDGLITYHHDYD